MRYFIDNNLANEKNTLKLTFHIEFGQLPEKKSTNVKGLKSDKNKND